MGKIVGLTYDLKGDWVLNSDDPSDADAELDKPQTVGSIAKALESAGHRVVRIGHVWNLIRQLDEWDVDIVFNICEGHQGRNRESQVPILLELKGIPYVGSDALTLGITLDKIVAKKCFIADRIPTPRFFEANDSENLKKKTSKFRFPLIVKPHHEGSSKGLSRDSRVTDLTGLKRQIDLMNKKYRQTALVEEFIKGTEFTVGVIGNNAPQALPVVQIEIEGKTYLGDDFYTFTRLSTQAEMIKYLCPAKIPKKLFTQLQGLAVKAYQSVGCLDFGRVDFRVDDKGNAYVLEVNPLPCLSEEDTFFFMAEAMGISFKEIVNQILDTALERYGLNKNSAKKRNQSALRGEEAPVLRGLHLVNEVKLSAKPS